MVTKPKKKRSNSFRDLIHLDVPRAFLSMSVSSSSSESQLFLEFGPMGLWGGDWRGELSSDRGEAVWPPVGFSACSKTGRTSALCGAATPEEQRLVLGLAKPLLCSSVGIPDGNPYHEQISYTVRRNWCTPRCWVRAPRCPQQQTLHQKTSPRQALAILLGQKKGSDRERKRESQGSFSEQHG